MKKLIGLMALLSMSPITNAKEPLLNEKGNGGDVVYCEGNIHTLDSVIMMEERYFDINRQEHYEISIKRIQNHLRDTLPLLEQTFNKFLDNFKTKGNVEEGVFWVKGKLKNVADENLFVELPGRCDDEVKQVVVLVKEPFKRYYYDASLIDKLSKNADELSWLFVHEWLRNYVDDSDVIRIINAYLHSEQFYQASEQEVEETLIRLGISSGYGPLSSEEKASTQRLKVIVPELEKRLNEVQQKLIDFNGSHNSKEKKKIISALNMEMGRLEMQFYIAIVGEYSSIDEALKKKLEMLYDLNTSLKKDVSEKFSALKK